MCDFDLERRKGKERRVGEGRPHTSKYLLDWVVRVLVIVTTILATAIFAQVRAISNRSHNLELRVTAIEANRFTTADAMIVWQAMSDRPTREEIQGDLNDIKQMIRDLMEVNKR